MWNLQQSCQELRQQLDSSVGSWRGQVDELKAQLRGEATRVLELQKKAYNAKMAREAAEQVCHAAAIATATMTSFYVQLLLQLLYLVTRRRSHSCCCCCCCSSRSPVMLLLLMLLCVLLPYLPLCYAATLNTKSCC